MDNISIVNLNQICKVCLIKKRKTDFYKWVETETWSQWFKNLFRKNKIKNRFVSDEYGVEIYTEEELEKFNEEHNQFTYNSVSNIFYEKAHVVFWYSGSNFSYQSRFFDSDKEAKAYFDKIVTYAKENNVPFVNLYSEK